jgi:hypothetical protein
MENNDGNNPLRHLTIQARLVVIAAIVGFPVGTAILICSVYDELPSGIYPIFFFALPVLVGMFLLVILCFRIMKWAGIPVYLSETLRWILVCPGCSQRVRVPGIRQEIQVTCPKCRASWTWPSPEVLNILNNLDVEEVLIQLAGPDFSKQCEVQFVSKEEWERYVRAFREAQRKT